ncbi:MAG TPA: surface-adhesin E family protein [Novosphingobium sp.]|nr:surface-adhesin E family protein [Novosphingobium sp.]
MASEWWFVGSIDQPTGKVAYFADAESAGGDERFPRLWVSRMLETAGSRGETKVTSIFTFDCAEKRMSEMQQMLVGATGDEIDAPVTLPSWSFVPPDSMGADLLRFRCGNWRPVNGKLSGSPNREVAQLLAFGPPRSH